MLSRTLPPNDGESHNPQTHRQYCQGHPGSCRLPVAGEPRHRSPCWRTLRRSPWNTRGAGLVRFGVFGSLSATTSASARDDRIMIAVHEPKKDIHEPLRSSHPRCAAQLTNAGAVSERNPAMTPMEKHPRYRTALLTFMPAYSSRKPGLVKNHLKSIDPNQQYRKGKRPDLARSIAHGHSRKEFFEVSPQLGSSSAGQAKRAYTHCRSRGQRFWRKSSPACSAGRHLRFPAHTAARRKCHRV